VSREPIAPDLTRTVRSHAGRLRALERPPARTLVFGTFTDGVSTNSPVFTATHVTMGYPGGAVASVVAVIDTGPDTTADVRLRWAQGPAADYTRFNPRPDLH
jgi:hypothetical protein